MQTIVSFEDNKRAIPAVDSRTWERELWQIPHVDRLLTITFSLPETSEEFCILLKNLVDHALMKVWRIAENGSALMAQGRVSYWRQTHERYDFQEIKVVFDAGEHGFKPGIVTDEDIREAKGDEQMYTICQAHGRIRCKECAEIADLRADAKHLWELRDKLQERAEKYEAEGKAIQLREVVSILSYIDEEL